MLCWLSARARALAIFTVSAVVAVAALVVVAPAADARQDRQPYTLLPLFHKGRYTLQLGKVLIGEYKGERFFQMTGGFDCQVSVAFGVIFKMQDCYPVSPDAPFLLDEDDVAEIIYRQYGPEDIKFTWWALHGHILLGICAVLWPIGAYSRWVAHKRDMERRVSKYR